jgi:hypothetical protein
VQIYRAIRERKIGKYDEGNVTGLILRNSPFFLMGGAGDTVVIARHNIVF